MLGVLDERQLAHAMFPLGDTLTTKDEIRAEAERVAPAGIVSRIIGLVPWRCRASGGAADG